MSIWLSKCVRVCVHLGESAREAVCRWRPMLASLPRNPSVERRGLVEEGERKRYLVGRERARRKMMKKKKRRQADV